MPPHPKALRSSTVTTAPLHNAAYHCLGPAAKPHPRALGKRTRRSGAYPSPTKGPLVKPALTTRNTQAHCRALWSRLAHCAGSEPPQHLAEGLRVLRATDGRHLVIRNPLGLRYTSHVRWGGEHPPDSTDLGRTLCGADRRRRGRDAKGQKQRLCGAGQLSHSHLLTLISPGCWGQPRRLPTSCPLQPQLNPNPPPPHPG